MDPKKTLKRLLPRKTQTWLLRLPQRVVNATERARRVPWPTEPLIDEEPRRVAVLTVNYNTLRDTAHLLFSIFRVLEVGSIESVVVVDNGSLDGSAEFLEALDRRGIIRLVRNRGAPRHGPGLNRGMNHLARSQHRGEALVDYVWIVDSDVIVMRPDAAGAALRALEASRAAVAGPILSDIPGFPQHAHVSSNLVDPRRIWRRGIAPFGMHGSPAADMQRDLLDRGERILNFPYYEEHYLLHLWGATRSALSEGRGRRSRHYHTPEGTPTPSPMHQRFLESFDHELPDLDPDRFAHVCRESMRVNVQAGSSS